MRKGMLLPLGIVLVLAIFAAVAYTVKGSQPGSSFTDFSHPLAGKVGDTLVTPEGAQIVLVATEQGNGQFRFHLKVHNSQSQSVSVWNGDADHGFALYNNATKTFVISPTTIPAADVATHPVLPDTVTGQGDADGWVAFAAPSPSPYLSTLYYRYRTVHTQRCPNPGNATRINKSQCQPADLYSTIHWAF